MKNITTLLLFLCALTGWSQITTTPNPPEADQAVTIYFDKAGTGLASYTGTIYAHMGVTVDGNVWQNVVGSWGNNTTQPSFTLVSGTTYSLDITPDLYTYFGVPTTSTISQISMVLRSADGSQQTSPDYFIEVGGFQMTALSPDEDSNTIVPSGGTLPISAATSLAANWTLTRNGTSVATATNTTTFSSNQTITGDSSFELTATSVATSEVITKQFSAITTPNVTSQAIPTGIVQGINYDDTDPTKVTLALYAPNKNYVHVIGSFNNWQISNSYLMHRDTSDSDLFWIEITGLTAGDVYSFQYRTDDGVKVADPYSDLILSPNDDPYIDNITYPNMPVYPSGQEFAVSVIQTNQADYNWQTTDFDRPDKEDLIIYELLIRDFNTEKTWTSLSNQIDYFKNLNINAIEIMPVMEFEGNISWGYNTAFHLALDKAYGPADTMKEFIDLCHENGIAVILDVALNHVYGRSPLVRMWMNDPDGDGYGSPTAANPYLNVNAMHAYSVGYDLNHQSTATQYYVERTIEHWINEFHIDGFRWDLTKGFTNNCTSGDENCTNAYQADRVAILKQYADYQWALDPDFYVIFEHLGTDAEQVEWTDYRINEDKGIMVWGKYTDPYNQNTMGYTSDSNFNGMDFENHGYAEPRLVGFAESHDEERMMFKNTAYGNASGTYNVQNTATGLERMKTLGAVLFTIPGPKMFWQFGELGYDYSINYCENGTINNDCRTNPKPIPSEIGYTTDANRTSVYDTWAEIIDLRLTEEVFDTETFTITSNQGNLLPKIHVWNDDLAATDLKDVVVLANFNVTSSNVAPTFPYTGTWYNLLDGSTINVTSTGTDYILNLAPGEYRIYGNQQPGLATNNPEVENIKLYPNPAQNYFSLSAATNKVQLFNTNGQLLGNYEGDFEAHSKFDISHLNTGFYIIKVIGTNGSYNSFKLFKN
ncbi:alpha-amylase family glycosyl hydrolase [Neptunitalea lumnitzerae]|uniref:Glycosyl hydrolase family 13 catalytic domain-containing protein n=1 Tax=Neptunitalea lumnitzerae TaxID=2965509 RepID=A0ABQ5MGM5_9FLAO|nr:alpha-amylase family glycosyl hydrolase [Neptunitalea sp. Y10]GLB48538.1 hypothetical protein Y10_09060 [Neptunitalea sp. Y10]